MPRPAHPLKQRRDRSGRTDLDDEIDAADVDAELERRGRHEGLQLASLESLFGSEPLFARQAAVMAGHLVRAEAIGQMHRQSLAQPAGVDEDQRGLMLRDQLGDPAVDVVPDLRRHHRLERR